MSELRPSFQERDRYLDLLSTAYADGRLDEAEFEARSSAVLAAVTHRDALAQFQGLPQPTIVPVTPPSSFHPQPPQAFKPLPERLGSRDLGRRELIAGLVGVAAVAGLGMAGLVSFSRFSDEAAGRFPDPAWSSLHDRFAEAAVALRDQGFDTVGSLAITEDQIQGTAGRSRAPGEVSSFNWFPDGSVQVSTPEGGSGSTALSLDEAEHLVLTAASAGQGNLPGAVAQLELIWDGSRPTAKATGFGADGWVQVDASGEIIAMEVP